MKRIILSIIGVVVIALCVYQALDSGIIWFVHPSEKEYPVQGIDISNHQGRIDWSKIPKRKVHFVYIKASEGGDFKDKSFMFNWTEAKKNGFPAGAYHFFTLCKPGVEQARNFISAVPRDPASLPPVLDLEYMGNCKQRPPVADVRKEIGDFLSLVDRHYEKKAIIYSTYEFIDKYLGNELNDRKLWIRDMYKNPEWFNDIQWTLWQYNSRGTLPGIKNHVDMNVFNGSTDEFNRVMSGF